MVICVLFDNQGNNVKVGLTFWQGSFIGLVYFLFSVGCWFCETAITFINAIPLDLFMQWTFLCPDPFTVNALPEGGTKNSFLLIYEIGKILVKPGQMKWLYPFFHLTYLHKPLKMDRMHFNAWGICG